MRMYATEKFRKALAKRCVLRQTGATAYRVVDGAGDDLPGLTIDDFDGNWLASAKSLQEIPKLDPRLGFRSLYGKILAKDGKRPPTFLAGEPVSGRFLIHEAGLAFWIDFQTGYSQGIFIDQRLNRQRVRAKSAGRTVLNTFAYTCAFGVAAAAGGAMTINVDLSRAYLDWGRDNYQTNNIDWRSHEFIYGDTFDWLKRFHKKGRRFDLIILDPPTFSRDRTGHVFRAETSYGELLALALAVVAPNGELLCSTNAYQLPTDRFARILQAKLPKNAVMEPNKMPEDFTGSDYLKSFWIKLSRDCW
jgi:23S rRNA (cytosine1962-C5)-methyltransferase